MEELIKQVLDTLAGLGESERVVLFQLEKPLVATIAGGFVNGHFMLPGKKISLKNTPLEEVVNTCKPNTYPGKLLNNTFLSLPMNQQELILIVFAYL